MSTRLEWPRNPTKVYFKGVFWFERNCNKEKMKMQRKMFPNNIKTFQLDFNKCKH